MARIRHIALGAMDTEATARFYIETFGMKLVHRHPGKRIKGRDAIYLSDGHINLAILPAGEGRRSEEHTSELQSPYDLVCRLLPGPRTAPSASGREYRPPACQGPSESF